MYELYFQTLNKKIFFSAEEQEIIKPYLTLKKLRKNQYLLQEGEICKSVAFVKKGVLKQFSCSPNGDQHIMQFAFEGWFISDINSFINNVPATYSIDVMEDAELLLISQSAQIELMSVLPKYDRFLHLQILNAFLVAQKRVNALISFSPEKRYVDFVSAYPFILQRIPQFMIASYLGMTPATLSRIRKKLAV